MEKKQRQKTILLMIISAAGGAALTYAGLTLGGYGAADNSGFSIMEECREIIAESGDPDFDDIAAVNGYLKAGGDDYTVYIGDDEQSEINQLINEINKSGTAVSSGFSVGISDSGAILLTDVQEDMAAYRSGLRAGDEITAINGGGVADDFLNTAKLIMGKQDTAAELTVLRDGSTLNITFTRDNEPQRGMTWEMLGNAGYIHIESFSTFTEGYFDTALEELSAAEGFVIDLRGSTGGQTDIAIACADKFVGDNYVTQTSFKGEETVLTTETDGEEITKPVVVLMNSETYSASEIVAALLKQGTGCTLVGERTFGKGIYQVEKHLEKHGNSGILHYTAGTYTVGDWECYNGIGIEPDEYIEMDHGLIRTDDDVQLSRALELIG
ncbi:MAG: PDZ domain-containing protein [Ruminococcus sp.]|nr:PDZ domain-containing protein [Ruminococcus sp.]